MEIPDPIQKAEDRLAVMLAGDWEGIRQEQAEAGLAAAHEHRVGGFGGRTLGFGCITNRQDGDGCDFVVAVTDGQRQAAIVVRLSGTNEAILASQKRDPAEEIIDRLNGISGGFPNDGHRYENVLLHDPINL